MNADGRRFANWCSNGAKETSPGLRGRSYRRATVAQNDSPSHPRTERREESNCASAVLLTRIAKNDLFAFGGQTKTGDVLQPAASDWSKRQPFFLNHGWTQITEHPCASVSI